MPPPGSWCPLSVHGDSGLCALAAVWHHPVKFHQLLQEVKVSTGFPSRTMA